MGRDDECCVSDVCDVYALHQVLFCFCFPARPSVSGRSVRGGGLLGRSEFSVRCSPSAVVCAHRSVATVSKCHILLHMHVERSQVSRFAAYYASLKDACNQVAIVPVWHTCSAV